MAGSSGIQHRFGCIKGTHRLIVEEVKNLPTDLQGMSFTPGHLERLAQAISVLTNPTFLKMFRSPDSPGSALRKL